jgi:hypothetical protein
VSRNSDSTTESVLDLSDVFEDILFVLYIPYFTKNIKIPYGYRNLGAGMAITLEDFGGHRPEKVCEKFSNFFEIFFHQFPKHSLRR